MDSQTLSSLASRCGVGLVYHAVFERVPPEIDYKLHNVTPAQLHRHLEILSRHFRFVGVDEFGEARSQRGLACLTFDDGYRNVIDAALPVLSDLSIPATVFVNGATLQGTASWRDKIRYLMANDLIAEFESHVASLHRRNGDTLYRYSKHPRNDSRRVAALVDRFFTDRRIDSTAINYCFDDKRCFVRHPLLAYGNHSHAHFVLSSLSRDAQSEQIVATHELLAAQPGITLSRWFAVPFGDERDFDKDTVEIARGLGYAGLVLSRGRAHVSTPRFDALPAVERVMPAGDDLLPSLVRAYRRACPG